MKYKLLLAIILGIFFINLVSAMDIDNIKGDLIIDETTSKYGAVEIKDWFGLLDLARLELKENTDICGEDCSMKTEIIMYQDGVLIDDVKFIGYQVTDYQFYVQTGTKETGVTINDYDNVCIEKLTDNKTTYQDCEYKIIGTHKGTKPIWTKYNLGDEVVKGTYNIKLEGTKDFYSSTDWIIKTQGKEITEWADWGVGGTITYDGDYTIHTSGTYNFYIDTIFPLINFTSPTPATGSQSNTNIFVNLTSSDTTSNISTFIDFDNSLVGWWRMDDTNGSSNSVLDISGYGNNGTAQGDASQTNAGKLGKGFEFDGEGDYVDLGEPTSLDIDFSQITLSAWIRADGSVKDYGIVGKSTIWYLSFTSSDDVRLRHVNVGDGLTGIDIGDPIDTSWHHVVGTYNGTNTSIYFDGVYKGGGAATGTLGTSTSDVAIGDLRVGYGYYFNGSIDDVMIFNRSLSAEEIKGLYANTSNKYLNNNFTDLAVGNHTFKAYTQDYAGNINETEERTITITSDSCTYSSGNWIINCEDNCTITTNVNGDGSNFSANGIGFFSIQANISGFKLYHFGEGCDARCSGGNCIKI